MTEGCAVVVGACTLGAIQYERGSTASQVFQASGYEVVAFDPVQERRSVVEANFAFFGHVDNDPIVGLAVQCKACDFLLAERQSERLLAETSARAIVREGETAAGALLAEASRRSLALQQEGARALELAGIERDGALGELLSTEGGRLYQAREAARALRFGRVTFDPADERVPSPFDLDALQELVLGREP